MSDRTRRPSGTFLVTPAVILILLVFSTPVLAFVIATWWPDSDQIVMDNIFVGGNWAALAEGELAKWNNLRSSTNDHPFLLNGSPEYSFNKNDGDNTMGFLDGALVYFEYGLVYGPAIAWTSAQYSTSSNEIYEADIMFDPAQSWSASTTTAQPFTTTMLHESGHAQGLGHESIRLSIMYPLAAFQLGATIYADDAAGIDSRYTALQGVDVMALNVYYDTAHPQWMTMGPTSLLEGDLITFSTFTYQNRGAVDAPNPTFKLVLSDSPSMSPPLTVLDTWFQSTISAYSSTSINRTVTIPPMQDCAVKYAGLLIPSNASWNESDEQNNIVAFTNASPNPQPLTIGLVRDPLEPNDTLATSSILPASPYNVDLSIDQDGESDFFVFRLNTIQWVYLTINYTYTAGDIDLLLFDHLFNLIGSATTGIGFNEIRQRLNPGDYFVRVYGNGAGSCNHYNFNFLTLECLQDYECDPGSTTFCASKACSNFTCVPVVPRPCDDGDACTRDICVQDHGGYCLFAPDPTLDPDGDGVCASLDCSPQDSQTWAVPVEATTLSVDADDRTLRWDDLAPQAGPGVVYDLLRGTLAQDGSTGTGGDICVAGVGTSQIEEAEIPEPGHLFWYLVRGRNSCGSGTFGTGTGGAEISVAPCE